MRIVRWTSQERVDQPDITSMSFLVLGETRRWSRAVVLGEDAANYVLRGFGVEPAAVPDSTIVVKLDPGGGGALSAALGGEDLGASVIHGQLMGDHDDAGNTEGNAQQSIDFTSEPAATYTVRMSFLYTSGVNDNRAFWNPSSNAEFIAAVDTRHLPQFQLSITETGPEWIDLGDVVWDTVGPITTSEITDKRVFAFEGDVTGGFQQTTQTGTGGIADFDRSATRDALTVGLNALYPAVRGLARQMQDVKGPDAAGMWNWWNRVYAVPDPGSARAAGITKSLRSTDTVTFTVGDGITDWGDFNGLGAIGDVLEHIEADQADMPGRIRIVVKSRDPDALEPAWTLANAVSIADKHIEIIGRTNGTVTGRAFLTLNHVAGDAINLTGDSSLVIENVELLVANVNTSAIRVDPVDGRGCKLVNVGITGDLAAATTGFAMRVPSRNLYVEGCNLAGRIEIGEGAGSRGGLITNSTITQTAIQLFNSGTLEDAANLTIANCSLASRSTGPYTAQPLGTIQAGNSINTTIENCIIDWHGDVGAGVYAGNARNLYIRNCEFEQTVKGTHAVDGGTLTTKGTGWAVFVDGSGGKARNVKIDNCRLIGGFAANEFIDGGGIFAQQVQKLTICDFQTELIGLDAGAGSRFSGIKLLGAGASEEFDAVIDGCVFRDWDSLNPGTQDFRAVELEDANQVRIRDCTFDGRDDSGTALTTMPATAGALLLDGCSHITVQGNYFSDWENSVNRTIRLSGVGGRLIFNDNTFFQCAEWVLQTLSGSNINCQFSNNIVVSTTSGFGGIDITLGTASGWQVCDNKFQFNFANDAIELGAQANLTVQGNFCGSGFIRHDSGPTGPFANVLGNDHDGSGTGAAASGEQNICAYGT
jgi:hypothetical protein